jgi:hypothetical protein
MKELVFVAFSNRYDFEDQKTGRKIKGANVHYIASGQEALEDKGNGYGKKLEKLGMNYEDCEFFREGTGIYEIDYEMGLSQSKPVITSSRLLEKIDLEGFFEKHKKKIAV